MMVCMSDGMTELWASVRKQLEQARTQLTDPDDEALDLYADFLRNNELGLALDVLADVGLAQRAPMGLWRALWDAVQAMDLGPGDSIHGPTVETISEQLNAAHDWRGLQRLLNEWDPIGVVPDLGGPDDEYSCLYAPLMDRLLSGTEPAEISRFLRAELSDHFGLEPTPSQPELFAERLIDWYAAGAPA